MGNFAKYFKRSEFSCRCSCGQDTVDAELLHILDTMRAVFDTPITINSGNRCFNHNHQIGGSPRSQHLLGKAADIKLRDVDPQTVYNYLTSTFLNKYGIGNYETFTHIDVRATKSRW